VTGAPAQLQKVNPAPTSGGGAALAIRRRSTVFRSWRSLLSSTLLGAGIACLGLAGCGEVDPPYSNSVAYGLRTDPLVMSDKLGDERFDPDRPGQLPILSLRDLADPLHPIHPKRDTWQRENLFRDPTAIPAAERQTLESQLEEVFGTPRHPKVALVSEQQKSTLKLEEETLAQGSVLYRVHCLHCHGVAGDGRGPTARWVNPHPRDFRQGLFKFQSVDQTKALGQPPRREDLYRTLHQGIDNSAMPSFALLPPADLEKLVSYVIHLSMRGKVEYDAFRYNFEFDDETGTWSAKRDNYPEFSLTKVVAPAWMNSQKKENKITIGPYPYKEGDQEALRKSVARGQQLFLGQGGEEGKAANCVSCHKNYGREATFRFDSWGTLVRPNNLTNGMYRGGRRTIDLYHRVHSGINGSGMLTFGAVLKNESVWDLINFVQALPYPNMRKNLGINID
jgi:mono/diheme cytochrome c family protein